MFRKGGNVGNGIMSGITDRVQAKEGFAAGFQGMGKNCLLYTSPSPRDGLLSRMPSSA